MNTPPELQPIPVWDLPTRLFHWSLVLLVAFSGISGELAEDLGSTFMDWHKWSGYAILALLLFRLAWGFLGGTYARFANFVHGPGTVLSYVGDLVAKFGGPPYVGHNPLGGWSVIFLLACLAVQVGTGLFISDQDLGVEGPLAKLVSNRTSDMLADLHEGAFAVLLTLIGIHLAAIAFYRLVKGENLVRPMVTGRKHLPASMASAAARGGHVLLGAVVLAVAVAAVWYLVNKV